MVPVHLTLFGSSNVARAPALGAVGRCPAAQGALIPGEGVAMDLGGILSLSTAQ